MGRRKGTRGTKHIDKEKEQALKAGMEAVRLAIDCNDEDGFVAMLKSSKPDITREELVSLVHAFRQIPRR
jgi:hypothetical protein